MKQFQTLRNPAGKNAPAAWYWPDERVQSEAAAQEAIRIEQWIASGGGVEPEPTDPEPTESELFRALHACAFRAGANHRPHGGVQRHAKWGRRWLVIREYIVQQNLGLVYNMMRRYRYRDLDRDEMLSEGLFALARSVERFNPWRGFRFSTYVCNAIVRAWGRRGRRETRYRKLLPVTHSVAIEEPPRIDKGAELYAERLQHALSGNLADLTSRESSVLADRFPAHPDVRQTLQEVARSMGLSKERVRQIQNAALKKLRKVLEGDPALM